MNKSKVLSWISRWCRPIGSYSIWYNDIIIHMAQLIGYFRINSQLTCCSTFKYSASACFVTSGVFFLMHWFAIRWPDWPTQIQHVELAEKSRWGPTSADGVEHTEKISRSTNKNCRRPTVGLVCTGLYVQQQYFLHAHRSMSVDVLAVTNYVHFHTKVSESCHDRTILILINYLY